MANIRCNKLVLWVKSIPWRFIWAIRWDQNTLSLFYIEVISHYLHLQCLTLTPEGFLESMHEDCIISIPYICDHLSISPSISVKDLKMFLFKGYKGLGIVDNILYWRFINIGESLNFLKSRAHCNLWRHFTITKKAINLLKLLMNTTFNNY